MTELTFFFRWNGILQCKILTIEGLGIQDMMADGWKWKRPENVTAQFNYSINTPTGVERRTTTLETNYALIENTIVLGLIHNDKQVATIIFTIDEHTDEFVCRIGKFTPVGVFNEMFYEEPEIENTRVRAVFGVDSYPDDLFEECC